MTGEVGGGLVFVYGTLREGFANRGRKVLSNGADFVGVGRVLGSLYDAGAFPVLVLEGSGSVVGEVYRLRRPHVMLERLDRYEGVGLGGLFDRRVVSVGMGEGDALDAWAYVWMGPVEGFHRVSWGDFVAYVDA